MKHFVQPKCFTASVRNLYVSFQKFMETVCRQMHNFVLSETIIGTEESFSKLRADLGGFFCFCFLKEVDKRNVLHIAVSPNKITGNLMGWEFFFFKDILKIGSRPQTYIKLAWQLYCSIIPLSAKKTYSHARMSARKQTKGYFFRSRVPVWVAFWRSYSPFFPAPLPHSEKLLLMPGSSQHPGIHWAYTDACNVCFFLLCIFIPLCPQTILSGCV